MGGWGWRAIATAQACAGWPVALARRHAFAQAAADLTAATGVVRLSASTVRAVTEGVGARREQALAASIAAAWAHGLPPAPARPPDRLYVAMDGCFILGLDGAGREVKVGRGAARAADARGERREAASYVAGPGAGGGFGRRLALEAHRRGAEAAAMIAVLGDGAAWIWTLAAEHFPGAVHIVDWYHASERVWALGNAMFGERDARDHGLGGAPVGAVWRTGQAATLAQEWRALSVRWRRRRGPRRAGDLLHQPGLAHGL